MLSLKQVTKLFYQGQKEIAVVNNISFDVKKGEVFGFLGPNGAGKTTTVKMIVGLLYQNKGMISIDGLSNHSEIAKQKIGFMPEQPQFYRHLKAFEMVELAGGLFGLPNDVVKKRSNMLLERVGLDKFKNEMVRLFSKGMQQRLAFATALVNEPELLILDEPLDGLDPIGRLDFKNLLLGLKKQGTTIFLNTHILSDVEEICDTVAILDFGQILKQGKPKDLITKNKTLEEIFVETIEKHKTKEKHV